MIELVDISKQYRYGHQSVPVLKAVSFQVETGACVCLRGPSGTGKTTLLNIIGGMLAPSSGTVSVNGTILNDLPSHFLSAYRRNEVGFIFQQFHLLGHLTIMENLTLPLVPSGKSIKKQLPNIEKLLSQLQIDHRQDFPVRVLSGGEQQRVAVARALVNRPGLILADEPFSNLDAKNVEIILSLFRELKKQGMTFVLSATSQPATWEQQLIDKDIAYAAE